MRADAAANREKLLDAASDLFGEYSIHHALHMVAERAGVGPGTLYRHFADRDAVIIGLCERLHARFVVIADEAAAAPTGWDALVIYIDGVTAMYIEFPWMADAVDRVRALMPPDRALEAAVFAQVQRAWDEGSLRQDVSALDLTFLPPMLGALGRVPEPMRGAVLARHRSLVLDSLRVDGAPRPPIGADEVTVEQFQTGIGRPLS